MRPQLTKAIDQFGDVSKDCDAALELVGDLLRQLPDRLLAGDGLRSATQLMARHGVQPREARAEPPLPCSDHAERVESRKQFGGGKFLLELCQHIGIDGAVVCLDGSAHVWEPCVIRATAELAILCRPIGARSLIAG